MIWISLVVVHRIESNYHHLLKIPLIIPPARFLANPEPYKAPDANPLAWLNLSHRENARVFVIVRTSAITRCPPSALSLSLLPPKPTLPIPSKEKKNRTQLTDKRQPNRLQTNHRNHSKHNPQHGLGIQRKPKEALIRRIDVARLRVRALKDPAPVARRAVDFVPPAQADEAPARNVLEVVEVDCEQQDGDDEDEDEVGGEELQAEEVDY